MRSSLFIKVKVLMFAFSVLVVIAGTGLRLDSISSRFRVGKIAVTVYVPASAALTEGPAIGNGAPVKIYKIGVGRVLEVAPYVVKQGTSPDGKIHLALGIKLKCEIYAGDYAPMMAMVSSESRALVESPMLGEPGLVLVPGGHGEPIGNNGRIGLQTGQEEVTDPHEVERLRAIAIVDLPKVTPSDEE